MDEAHLVGYKDNSHIVTESEGGFYHRELGLVAPVADQSDVTLLKRLIERHAKFTGSARARHVLSHWDDAVRQFVRVVPTEYLRALRATSETAARQESERHG